MLIKALTGADPEVGDYPFTTRVPGAVHDEVRERPRPARRPPSDDRRPDGELAGRARQDRRRRPDRRRPARSGRAVPARNAWSPSSRRSGSNSSPKTSSFPEEETGPAGLPETDAPRRQQDRPRRRTARTSRRFEIFFGEPVDDRSRLAVGGGRDRGLKKADLRPPPCHPRLQQGRPGRKPDNGEPFVLKRGTTVIELARAVHKDFAEKLNYARLWRGRMSSPARWSTATSSSRTRTSSSSTFRDRNGSIPETPSR